MKATESYWKDTVAVYRDTNSGVIIFLRFLTFLQVNMQKFYLTKRSSVKNMPRIHEVNLFHIRRSLHLFFF